MKYFVLFLLLHSVTQLKAQDFEVKIVSNKYQTITGQLKKVSVEGIGVIDFMGNYLIYRPNDIMRIKIRKRGLRVGEGAGAGALVGLGIGGLLLSADKEGNSSNDLLKLTAVLTVSGAAVGTITGTIAQIANTKLTLRINESEEVYKANYKKLEKYIISGSIEYLN